MTVSIRPSTNAYCLPPAATAMEQQRRAHAGGHAPGFAKPYDHHQRHQSSGVALALGNTSLGRPQRRQQSTEFGAGGDPTDGCCLIKTLISNLLTFATRSRRKAADLQKEHPGRLPAPAATINTVQPGATNNAGPCTAAAGAAPIAAAAATVKSSPTTTGAAAGNTSLNASGSTRLARKQTVQQQPSVETCVADAFDEQMIERICAIPPGMDRNEWLATQVLALFEYANALCGTVSDVCTPVTCSVMSFPGTSKAAWLDERGKRHHYAAMRYIDSVMSLCEASHQSQALFPTKFGCTFPADFEAHCRRLCRLLWHCLGHLYAKHWAHLGAMNLRPQFGLVLAHMLRVAKVYALLEAKELAVAGSTLQAVRPAGVALAATAPEARVQARPAKRTSSSSSSSGGKDAAAPEPAKQQLRHNWYELLLRQQQQPLQMHVPYAKKSPQVHVPYMKSGSWGGHPAGGGRPGRSPTIAGAHQQQGATHAKCYAQTC